MGGSEATVDGQQRLVGGRYRLVHVIGSGGMGRVWLADDELLRRRVAVKEIDTPADMSSADMLTTQLATMREARAAARLDHPGVVRVFDVVWGPGRSWIVMEYVKSRSLHDIVRAEGPLTHREASRIGLAVLQALRAAHAAGVLHRDVKPHNVLVADNGRRVVLSDFGLATFEGADSSDTGPLMGSPHFLAPERLRPGNSADGRSSTATSSTEADLWSLGATLYFIIEGRAPFLRQSITDSLTALVTEPPDAIHNRGPLEPLILGLLAKDPGRRTTAEAAEEALRRLTLRAVGTVPMPARPVEVSEPVIPQQRRPGGSAAVPVQSPAAAEPSARNRVKPSTRVAVIAAAAVLAATVGTALAFDSTRGTTGQVRQTLATSSASSTVSDGTCGAEGSDAAPVTEAPGKQPYALPDGWIWHQAAEGFRLAVPQGWTRVIDGSAVCFRDPDGARTFTVDTEAPLTRRPLAFWQQQEKDVTLPGYRRVAMGVLLLKNGGADWEYTWAPDGRPRQHVRRLLLSVSAQRAYLLQWTTGDQDWPLNEPYQRLIVASFS